MNVREVEKILKADGWTLKNQRGSHRHYVHATKPGKVTIPVHRGDIHIRTVKSIFTQAGIDWKER